MPARRHHVNPKESAGLLDRDGADRGLRRGPVRNRPRAGVRRGRQEESGSRVVQVDDRGPGPGASQLLGRSRGRQSTEQAQLGIPVGLERPVKLQVLVTQVREDRHVVFDLRDSPEGQAVGGRLDNCRLVAGQYHRPKGALQLRRLRRSDVLPVGAPNVADLGRRRGHETRRDPRRVEHGGRHVRGGRLAVRAGDPDDSKRAARILVPPRRGRGQGLFSCRRRRSGAGPPRGSSGSTIAATAPASAAAARKSCPSAWTPGMATKMHELAYLTRIEGYAADAHRRGIRPVSALRRDGALGRPDAPQAATGIKPLDQLPERAALPGLGSRERLGQGIDGGFRPTGRPIPRHSPASAACAGRPRCPFTPCFHRPMRSCIDWAPSKAMRPSGSRTRSQAPM